MPAFRQIHQRQDALIELNPEYRLRLSMDVKMSHGPVEIWNIGNIGNIGNVHVPLMRGRCEEIPGGERAPLDKVVVILACAPSESSEKVVGSSGRRLSLPPLLFTATTHREGTTALRRSG